MKQNADIVAEFLGILIIHQKIRGYSVDIHHHGEHEIFLPLSGEIRVAIDGKTLKAGVGKMLYLPAGIPHSFESSSSAEGERLIFLLDSKAWRANAGGKFPPSVISTSQLCKELLFHLLLNPKTKAAKPLLQTLIQTVSEMLDAGGQGAENVAHLPARSSDPRIAKALDHIAAHFAESISAAALAKVSAMSVRTQNRLFLTELGMTPKQVVTLHRIERAKKLLGRRNTSVTDVAFEVGYQSVSQFITVFRGLTGRLPSEFLK